MEYESVGKFESKEEDPETDPDDPSKQQKSGSDDLKLGTPTRIFRARIGYDSFENRVWPAPLSTMKRLPCVAAHSRDDRFNDVVEFVVALCHVNLIKLEEIDQDYVSRNVQNLIKLAPNGNVSTIDPSLLAETIAQRAFQKAYTDEYIQFCRDNAASLSCTERYSLYCRSRELGVNIIDLIKKAPYECAKVAVICRKEFSPRDYQPNRGMDQVIFHQDLFPFIQKCALTMFGLQYNYIEQIRRHAVEAIRYHIRDGHTFVDIETVWTSLFSKNGALTREHFNQALEKPILPSLVPKNSFALSANEDWDIVNINGKLFPEPLYRAEKGVANYLSKKMHDIKGGIDDDDDDNVDDIAFGLGMMIDDDLNPPIDDLEIKVPMNGLSEEQMDALKMSCKNKVMVLTGGPGTGKTTTVARIAANLALNRYTVYTVAFTGKASNRAAAVQKEKTDKYVKDVMDEIKDDFFEPVALRIVKPGTIHKYVYSARNTINNALIVDEASMCSIMTIHMLLKVTMGNVRIIVVGDNCQLPPVSHGVFLDDLIRSNTIPCANLTRNFRAESVPGLIKIQSTVRKAIIQNTYVSDPIVSGVGFKIVPDLHNRIPFFVDLYRQHAMEGDSVIPGAFLIVVNTRGESNELVNQAIRDEINPFDGVKREHNYRKRVWREGDRIMCVNNLYERKETKEQDPRTIAYMKRNKIHINDKGTRKVSTLVCANGESGEIVFIGYGTQLSKEEKNHLYWKFAARKEVVGIKLDTNQLCYMPLSVFNKNYILSYVITVHKAQGDEYDRVVYAMKPRSIMNRPRIVLTALSRAKNESIYMGDKTLLNTAINNIEADKRNTQLFQFLKEFDSSTGHTRKRQCLENDTEKEEFSDIEM